MLILHILNLNARAAVELERAQSGRANIKHFLIHTLTHTHTHSPRLWDFPELTQRWTEPANGWV